MDPLIALLVSSSIVCSVCSNLSFCAQITVGLISGLKVRWTLCIVKKAFRSLFGKCNLVLDSEIYSFIFWCSEDGGIWSIVWKLMRKQLKTTFMGCKKGTFWFLIHGCIFFFGVYRRCVVRYLKCYWVTLFSMKVIGSLYW